MSFLATEIHKGFIPLLYARLAGPYATRTATPKLEQRFAWLDRTLADRDYLMGDTFTVADTSLYALVQWGRATWLEPTYGADIHFDGLGHLATWYRRVRARPAVRRSLDTEGLR